jgi:quercetin dioxygenase-like cupin family protein
MSENIQVGSIRMEFLRSKHDTAGSLDLMRMTVPPAGQMPVSHYHRNWDETVHGLEGTITFTVDGADYAVEPADALFIKRGIVHGFDNHSGADATCLIALTPGVLGPEYFRELAALIPKGPPNEAIVHEIMLRHGLVPAG